MNLNQVYHMKAEDLLPGLDEESIDLIVTSPPYDKLRTYKGFTWDFEYIARQSYRVLSDGGVLVWVVTDATIEGDETFTSFEQALYFKKAVGFKAWDTMIYRKTAMPGDFGKRYTPSFEYMFVLVKGNEPRVFNMLTRKNKQAGKVGSKTRLTTGGLEHEGHFTIQAESRLDNVWDIVASHKATSLEFKKLGADHPAKFPEALAERHILTWSNPGDTVLDYFGGSGTTAKMARIHNRKWITADISAEYCELMKKRLSMPFTPDMFSIREQS